MTLRTDVLLERIRLKSELLKWRGLAIIMAIIAAFLYFGDESDIVPGRDYVARIVIEGIIDENFDRDEIITGLANNSDVEAIIVYINTPGGTVVGGENLYNILKDLSAKKPVVSVMGTMATSAGYMVALGTEHIFANKGTITGSIGVLLQSVEIVELAKKAGINFDTVKSSPLKATPSPLEKFTPEARVAIQEVIDDFYNVFVDMVVEGRKITKKQAITLADGRIYTGGQAVKNGLVDEIGTEKEALDWLKKNKNVTVDKIKDINLSKDQTGFSKFFEGIFKGSDLVTKIFSLQGLLSIWSDGII